MFARQMWRTRFSTSEPGSRAAAESRENRTSRRMQAAYEKRLLLAVITRAMALREAVHWHVLAVTRDVPASAHAV